MKKYSSFLLERYELAQERIKEITTENVLVAERQEYFAESGSFLIEVMKLMDAIVDGSYCQCSCDSLKNYHDRIYESLLPEKYETSYLNPAYAVLRLGDDFGKLLSAIYADCTAAIGFAYEGNLEAVVTFLELLIQIYVLLEGDDEDKYKLEDIKDAYYWFVSDYSELFVTDSVEKMINPNQDFYTEIIENDDLDKDDYLYRLGNPISDNELKMAAHLRGLSEDKINAMAATYVEGYRKGFEVCGKDISIKETVQIYYPIGMELVVKSAIEQFRDLGFAVTLRRESTLSFLGRGGGKYGGYSTSVNKQFDFDHKDDMALYLDKAMSDRLLEVRRVAFEHNRQLARLMGGPAVIEVFGEEPFEPANKEEAVNYSKKGNEIKVAYTSKLGVLTNEFIPGDERSFTIIAYPCPAIGENFSEIFDRTVEINNLDYEKYKRIQQNIIDVLDKGVAVHITGRGDNHTDITVALQCLTDPSTQTNFENCVADVNIPVGEVFTSPELDGTSGILHVTQVYLNELCYKNLELKFEDGVITDYNCSNFDKEEDNKKYIFNNVLFKHDTLPMGEFAIGTNTTAYKMGLDFGISDKLPILIAEKTGPHFAVGDTCYSHAEEVVMLNPDGKECIARENKFSRMRNEDMSKAYFNCHTDITIPYFELGDIVVITPQGDEIPIIEAGRFVVSGTEELNDMI